MVVSVTYHNHSNSFKNTCFILLNMFKTTEKGEKRMYPSFPGRIIAKAEGSVSFPPGLQQIKGIA